jgi:phospholipid transport system substrate-binding protein
MPRRTIAAAMIVAIGWLGMEPGLSPAFASAVAAPDASPDPAGPQELMSGLSTRLLAALDRERSVIRRQPDLALPLVDELLSPHFDTQYAARLVLGASWRGATAEQRERFALALYRTLLRTYAGAVSEWTPDRLKILPLRDDAAALQVMVRTEVMRPGSAVVPVDYRLHRTADGWKIFDVIVQSVSYVRNYHDDIDMEIRQKGLDSAIARLEKRNHEGAVHSQ